MYNLHGEYDKKRSSHTAPDLNFYHEKDRMDLILFALSASAVVATDFLKTFVDYPQCQTPGSFSVDRIMDQLEAARAADQ